MEVTKCSKTNVKKRLQILSAVSSMEVNYKILMPPS